MDYFVIAIVSAWILGVFYPVVGVMVLVGFRISRPIVATPVYRSIMWIFAIMFFGLGLHYLHLGYFGAVHGILPSQETLVSSIANVVQVFTLVPVLFIAIYVRFRVGPVQE